MKERFKNKYRASSARLQSWNYGWDGYYFITICTKKMECYFGKILDDNMELSPIGVLAYGLWCEIKNHTKNCVLGEFVVMPNHIHGIMIIENPDNYQSGGRDKACLVSTGTWPSSGSATDQSIGQQRFQNQGKNTISSIVGGYKSTVTKYAHRLGYEFAWQPRFYDHIIGNEKSFNQITEYVIYNPKNWEKDKYHPVQDDLL